MKICSKCKIEKDIIKFHKSKNHKDGLNLWCKDCKKINAQENNKKNVICVDCKKPKTNYRNFRCKRCAYDFRIKNNPNLYFFCAKCGKEKNTYGEKKHSLCRSCAYTGRIPSQKTREIWSKQRKNKKLSSEIRKLIILKLIGQKRSIEQRTKLSNSKTGLNRTTKEYEKYLEDLHKEGRREKEGKNFQYKCWAKSVKERDKYICRRCFTKSKDLHAHHIKSWHHYPDFRFDINNGICLCHTCHKFVHKNKEEGFVVL